MDMKQYVGVGDFDVEQKRFDSEMQVADNGRRTQQNETHTQLDDGTLQIVNEMFEESIPMRLTERVTRKVKAVPVEERTEVFGEDGSVETKVRTLGVEALNFDTPKEDLIEIIKALSSKVDALAAAQATLQASMKVAQPVQEPVGMAWTSEDAQETKNTFRNLVSKKYGKKAVDGFSVPEVPEVVPAEDTSVVEGSSVVTWAMWVAAAVAAAVVVYSLI